MKDNYDVIVIGAGIGGLSAGALLARRGYSVAVFEAMPVAGGYCTSFRRRGHTFDSCLDAISGCGERGWLRRILRELEVENEAEFVRLDPLRVDNFAGKIVEIPGEYSAFKEKLFELAPKEKEGAAGLLKVMEEIYRTAMVTHPEVLYNDKRLLRKTGSALSKYLGRTYKDLLDDFIKDERIRAVMSDRSAFMGLPPSKVSAVAMATMFMTFAIGGGYRIKDGAQRLTDAFVIALRLHGGELFYRSKVEEITRENGRVAGVKIDGQMVRAKSVVSAIDANKTFSIAGMEIQKRALRPSVSFFMVYLALDGIINLPHSMGYYPDYNIESTFTGISTDIVSPGASMEIINYSGISPSMAPGGKSTVMLMAKAAYGYKEPWYTCKKEVADRMIEQAERVVPELKGRISYSEAATPFTLERYTGNSAGAAFGWEQGLENQRESMKTPLPGLYRAGHWTYPGGGIESVAASGLIAAEAAVSNL